MQKGHVISSIAYVLPTKSYMILGPLAQLKKCTMRHDILLYHGTVTFVCLWPLYSIVKNLLWYNTSKIGTACIASSRREIECAVLENLLSDWVQSLINELRRKLQ